MKKILFALLCMVIWQTSHAQLNMSLRSSVPYNVSLNDVWGWAAPDGTEYAIVGLQNGVSIVSLEDPDNAVQVAFVPGPSSTWRDIKTWENHAYITNETGDGLLVIDMSNLPNDFSDDDWFYWAPDLPNLGTLSSCHNIYIDEFGVAYLVGCNLNSGGSLFIDVFTDQDAPELMGVGTNIYSHDIYVRDNIAYNSEIYAGRLAIYDVSDKNNPVLLGSTITPEEFTHNAWLNDAGDVVFTTDERANAPVAAYDISDFSNIVELDQYRPLETLGAGVIPHNVHVWDDWLVISYYTDGGIIVDASRPENLIETGNFDTFLGGDGGFSGAWGLYPFLPSGLVLVSDIGNGLYVLDADYVRACWLEGEVTDAVTGALLNGVTVEIDSDQANMGETDAFGKYATGQALPGTFDVTFTKFGYESKTVPAELDNGLVTMLDVELNPLQSYTLTGSVFKNADGSAVGGANVVIINENAFYEFTSAPDGSFIAEGVIGGTYDIYAGAWGYKHAFIDNIEVNSNDALSLGLDEGYQDDFILDFEWQTTTSNPNGTGFWTRDEPTGTNYQGSFANPDFDVDGDLGNLCYMTGNGGGGAGTDDVDDAVVTLTSPVMDLSNYAAATLSYRLWFFNDGGNGSQPNDALTVTVSNGTDEVELESITFSVGAWRPTSTFELADFITLTDNMTVSFQTSDTQAAGHLVEAAVDQFLVEAGVVSTFDLEGAVSLNAFPNPFKEEVNVQYELKNSFTQAFAQVYNSLGQKVLTVELADQKGNISLGENFDTGVYLIQIEADGELSKAMTVTKIK